MYDLHVNGDQVENSVYYHPFNSLLRSVEICILIFVNSQWITERATEE